MAEDKEVTVVEKKSFGSRLGSALFGAAKIGAVGALAGTATAAVVEALAPGTGEVAKAAEEAAKAAEQAANDALNSANAAASVAGGGGVTSLMVTGVEALAEPAKTTGEKLLDGAVIGAEIGGLVGAGTGLGEKYKQPEESWARKIELQRNQAGQNTGIAG